MLRTLLRNNITLSAITLFIIIFAMVHIRELLYYNLLDVEL